MQHPIDRCSLDPVGTSDQFFDSVQLTGVTLRVSDIGRVALFYEDQLGLRRLAERDGSVGFSATGREPALIELESAPTAPKRSRGAAGLFHVAFLFPDRAALGRIFARLIEEDVRLGAADHGVSEALYLSDPEGNGLELYADRPHSEWPPSQDGQVAMFTEALDAPSLLAAGHDGVGPRMPADTRIGHIHLSVSSLDKADAFYESILGFAIRQRDYPGARFYGRDGYHHHLAANTWQSQGAASHGALGLSRFSIRLQDPAPLVERARAAGRAVKELEDGTLLQDFDGIGVAMDPLEARK